MALLWVVVLAAGGAVLGAITGSILAGLAGGLVAGYFVGSFVVSGRQMQAFRTAYELRVKQASGVPDQEATGDDPPGSSSVPGGQVQTSSKQRRAIRAVAVVYGTVLTLGFVLGFVLVGGAGIKRFLFGVLGLLLAIAILSIVSGLIRVGIARKTPKHPGTAKLP